MDQVTVACVIAARDAASTIERTLRSLDAQRRPADEIVVVDDGSVDATAALALAHPRVRVVRAGGVGAAAARNAGAATTTASHLVFLDADDEADPEWLAALAQGATDAVGVVCCGVRFRSARGERVQAPATLGAENHGLCGLFLSGSFLVRRDLFARVGGYAEALRYSENTELSYRVCDAIVEAGLRAECVARPLVTVHERAAAVRGAQYRQARLDAATYFVAVHGARLRARPEALATYGAIGGLAAAQLHEWARARALFRVAVRNRPASVRYWARLASVLVAPVARRLYGGHDGTR